MPAARAVSLTLTASEHHRLKKMAYGHKTPHQARQHAATVLPAARGAPMPGNPCRRGCIWTRCRCAPGGACSPRRPARPRRPQAVRSVGLVHRVAGRRSQGAGPPVTRQDQHPQSCWSCPELVRRRLTGPSPGRTPLPPCGAGSSRTRSSPGSTSPGSSYATRLPAQGRACVGPVHPHVRRHRAGRGRVRDLGGREDFHPGSRPPNP